MPRRLSRRTLLRGLGTAIALPWLEAMGPVAHAGGGAPKRLVVYYIPNGMWMPDFTPTQEGRSYDLPWLLEPLAPVQDKLLVLSGIDNESAPGEPHSAAMGALMSGRRVETDPFDEVDLATTADQVVAQAVGAQTRFPSLQLGSEASFVCDLASGAGEAECAYLWNLSWADAVTPLVKETRPERVFERLFGSGATAEDEVARAKRRAYDQSVLDAVVQDAARLQGTLGYQDRQRLDQYLTGIHELERRLEIPVSAGCQTDLESWLASHPVGAQGDVASHVRHMADLMVLAMQCDQTRVISYMLGNGRSDRPFPFIGVPDSHHWLSHHEGDSARIDGYRTICRWEMEQLAAFLQAMDAVVEPGGGTLLDASAVLACSAISEPNEHRRFSLPVVVAGGAGGALDTGRHMTVPMGTLMASLHVSLMQAMDLSVMSFGERASPSLGGITR